MRFVNLCKHSITYRHSDGTEEVFEPSGQVAIVTAQPGKTIEEDGYTFTHAVPNLPRKPRFALTGLPDRVPGVVYITSMFAANIAWEQLHRYDVCSPGTGPADNPIRTGDLMMAVTRWRWPYTG